MALGWRRGNSLDTGVTGRWSMSHTLEQSSRQQEVSAVKGLWIPLNLWDLGCA